MEERSEGDLQKELEAKYNVVYASLEQICKLINHPEPRLHEREIRELYSACNAAIENLFTEETFSSLIESLQQLQYSLTVHLSLLDKLPHPQSQGSIKEGGGKVASCAESFYSTTTLDSIDSASGVNQQRREHLNEPNHEGLEGARAQVILAAKKEPSHAQGLSQVAGMDEAKKLLQEALVLPLKYPHLFQGCRRPWSSILLYGPPGTGKTRLAHAVAAEIGADFYCISTADLLSSWVGESEKLVRELFSAPHRQADSQSNKPIIFIDEIDSLCRRRSASEADHARRLKTELLIQFEEAARRGIFLLCATNCPWDMDSAFLRRFQRRIYIPTPDRVARQAILQLHSGLAPSSLLDWTQILDRTEGYSGSDLAALAQYALLQPIRELEGNTCWTPNEGGLLIPSEPSSNNPRAIFCSLNELPPNTVGVREVRMNDFLTALACTPPTVSKDDQELYFNFSQQKSV